MNADIGAKSVAQPTKNPRLTSLTEAVDLRATGDLSPMNGNALAPIVDQAKREKWTTMLPTGKRSTIA